MCGGGGLCVLHVSSGGLRMNAVKLCFLGYKFTLSTTTGVVFVGFSRDKLQFTYN